MTANKQTKARELTYHTRARAMFCYSSPANLWGKLDYYVFEAKMRFTIVLDYNGASSDNLSITKLAEYPIREQNVSQNCFTSLCALPIRIVCSPDSPSVY